MDLQTIDPSTYDVSQFLYLDPLDCFLDSFDALSPLDGESVSFVASSLPSSPSSPDTLYPASFPLEAVLPQGLVNPSSPSSPEPSSDDFYVPSSPDSLVGSSPPASPHASLPPSPIPLPAATELMFLDEVDPYQVKGRNVGGSSSTGGWGFRAHIPSRAFNSRDTVVVDTFLVQAPGEPKATERTRKRSIADAEELSEPLYLERFVVSNKEMKQGFLRIKVKPSKKGLFHVQCDVSVTRSSGAVERYSLITNPFEVVVHTVMIPQDAKSAVRRARVEKRSPAASA
jgi:hypothetical protein